MGHSDWLEGLHPSPTEGVKVEILKDNAMPRKVAIRILLTRVLLKIKRGRMLTVHF